MSIILLLRGSHTLQSSKPSLPYLNALWQGQKYPLFDSFFWGGSGSCQKHRKSHHCTLYRELALTDMQWIHCETVLSGLDHPPTDQVVIWWLIIDHLIWVQIILTHILYMTMTWLQRSKNAVVSFLSVLLLDIDARCLSNPGLASFCICICIFLDLDAGFPSNP